MCKIDLPYVVILCEIFLWIGHELGERGKRK